MAKAWFASSNPAICGLGIFVLLAWGCGPPRPKFDFGSVVGYQLQLFDEAGNMVTRGSGSTDSGRRELKSKTPFSIRGRIFSPAAIGDKVLLNILSFQNLERPITTTSRLIEIVPGEPGHYAYEFALEGVPRPGPYLVQVILIGDPLSEMSFYAVP